MSEDAIVTAGAELEEEPAQTEVNGTETTDTSKTTQTTETTPSTETTETTKQSNTAAVQLPSRDAINKVLHLDSAFPQSLKQDEAGTLTKISTLSTSYDKSSSNYLLQSKHNLLSLKFRDKSTTTQKTIEDGASNIKNTFTNIKSIVGNVGGMPYQIDWDFWTLVVNDYDYIVNNKSDQLNELITQGIPSEIRGIIWQIVTRSKDTNLEDLYRTMKLEPSIHEKAIKRDLTRTSFFTNIDAANKADELFNVIKVYSLYDPDVGYTQGMIFIAIPLIMNMHESECFCLLVFLMKEYRLRELFCPEMKGLHLLLYQFDCLLAKHTPVLYNHLVHQEIKSSMYASQWFLTFFAYKFPLDIVLRIFDVVVTQGIEAILKFAVNLMVQNEQSLLALKFDKLLDFLKTKLFNIYVNPEYIRQNGEPSTSSRRLSAILTRRSSTISATSPTSLTATPDHKSYYLLDQLVQDAMKINIDPLDLTKFENMFEKCYNEEKSKLGDIEAVKFENGKLRHQLKHLEFQYSTLGRDHVDIMQRMVDLKVTLPEILSENEEIRSQIADLQQEITNMELKAGTDDSNEVPSAIEEKIKELLMVNAQEVELTANLEDELNSLVEEQQSLDAQLTKSASPWYKWGK
ncbi:uncharacterized protein LODBEIA_P38350 [Lodderomyces beijingensis]|uniref:Oxidant-induced cell-cycle arrest protein 5 n=1 Tax=Lodderomyces beijingensis TaxID=1775926 RepID=A0ABP0ZN88_9ASCO